MDYINIGLRSYTIILLISTSLTAGSNVNCNGKAFHCVNSTHFKICVDLGGGVSTTVDEFLIPCPQNTVCKQYNLFECEYESTTTPPVTIQSEVTNEQFKTIDSSVREQLDITTLFPTKQQEGMEFSEKYFDNVNATSASFTESLLTDAVIYSVNTSNANDLQTSNKGYNNKTLNISQSTDKELTSITEAGIDVTKTSPYNINTLVTDIGVSSKYNTETPVFLSTTQDGITIDSFKSESLEPLNQNRSDLDANYTVTKRTNQVSTVSESQYSAVTLLPGNFSDPSLQENTPGISNINHLIKPDNTSQDNFDILIKFNSTQLNNSDNSTQYRNINDPMYSKNTSTDINTLNSTPFDVITDEIFTSSVSDINKESKVNSVITLKSSRQHFAEITTASTIIVPGTTNEFRSHISLNTEVIETLFNDGLNSTTDSEKISVSDGDIMTSTSFIPETSVAKINDMSSQIIKSDLKYGVSSVILTKPVLDEKNDISNKSQISDTKSLKLRSNSEILNLTNIFEGNFTELNSVNNSQYLATTDQYFHERTDIPISSTSKSEVSPPINITDVLPFRSKEATQVYNALQINNVNTREIELVSTKTPEIQSNSSFLPRSNFSLFTTATKTATGDKIILGDYSFTNVDMLPDLTTTEMSNGATNLKLLPDLISENKPSPESVILVGATGLDNNNITIKEESNNITLELSHGVPSLNLISNLISKNETSSKSVMMTVATDLDNNNITTTEESNIITAELSNGVTRLKPISDLISKNETSTKSVTVTVATDLDNNNTTITEVSNNITGEISKGVTSLRSIFNLNRKNETSPKSVIVTVATDLDNNNTTTTGESYNTTGKISKGVTSLLPISDLMSKKETWLNPVIVTVATDLDNNNTTTTGESYNTTGEISKGVTTLKPISDLISKNKTWPKPVIVTVATNLDNNDTTITEESNNITGEISKGVTSLKSISNLISKNETSSKLVMVIAATDLDNNNTITTGESYNTTGEISNGVTTLKPISDLISKNETWPKPVMVTVATDLDNNNTITTGESYNTTGEISKGVTTFKPISDLISKNKTWPKPVIVTAATDLDNNNTTTTGKTYNTTGEISKGVTTLKPISDLISKNETWPQPVIVTAATDLDYNNTTTTGESYYTTGEISKGVTTFKPISDLISKNETRPKPVMVTVATDLDNNNTTTTGESYNTTGEISKGVTTLKPISDLISKNETWPQPVIVTAATDLDNNNTTTTGESYYTTGEISKGVTTFKHISDLISKYETRPKPVMVTVATDLDNNNTTTTGESYNTTGEISKGVTTLKPISDLISKNETRPKPVMVTVATDLDINNTTFTEESNNITGEITKEVTSLKPISDLTPTKSKTQPTVLKLLTANDTFHKENIFETTSTILTEDQSLNESTTSLSSITKIPDNILKTKDLNKDLVRQISSTDSVISDLERNTTRIVTNLPTTLENPTTLFDRSSGALDNNNTDNNDTTKPIINPLNEINKSLSSNYTHKDTNNSTSDVYQSTTKSDRALNTVETLTGPALFESPNSMNVTNNTFIVIDVLSEHRVVSDKNKNIENTSKLKSEITTKPSTYFDSNKSIRNISSDTKNMTTSSQSTKYDINAKQVIYKNTNDKNKIVGQNTFGNLNSTKLYPENILTPKFVTSNNFSSSPAFHITYINNNITDKNNKSLKDVEVKNYQVTNNLVEKLLTVGVNNTDLNYTDNNVVASVSNNSKSIPLIYLHSSLTKPPLTNIYNISHSENISRTHTVNNTTTSNKNHKIEDKDSSQTNINEPAHAISIIKHERNKTEYVLHNPYTQVNTTAMKVNDTTLKELTYNFSEPSFTVRNNVNGFIMKNITISIDNNTAPKSFYDTKGNGYNKSNSTTTIKSVNTNSCTNCSKLADNFKFSKISNSQLSGIVIKPLLIEPLRDVKNTSSLYPDNENLYSDDILNNRGIVNTTLVANYTKPTETPTLEGNVSEVNNLTFIRTTEKNTNELNATSESNNTANNLLRNTSSQTNIIKNKTYDELSSNGLQFSRIPSNFDKSSQSTGPLKMETNLFVSNRTNQPLEIISEQEKNTTSDHTNRSNGMEKKQLTNAHGHSESNITIANGVTKNNRNNTQASFTTPNNNINYPNRHYGNLPTNQEFRCTKRGKFSDAKDCKKFFVCIGRVQPVIGLCPTDTVFSEYLKQCTKNVTHCIRNNLFKCTAAGRFINILCNNTYFICAKKNSSFIKFTFQCQKGYYLDKNNIKCTPEIKNISKSDESSSKNTKELSFDKSKEVEGVSISSKDVFECEKEGKFKDPQDCRKYYVCKKGRNSIYRRKIKQCDSDEVFHRKKKKCVDVESYECNM